MSNKLNIKENSGIISLGDSAINMVINNSSKEATDIFFTQVIEAINRINSINELTQEQKDYLVSIVNEAKTVEGENEKISCKNSFESFMKGLGKTSEKVLSVLADLFAVANFFGIG
ncbi:MAG: hypothetical protein FWE14_08705 [Lachnospiraceae bacterium]|nr:hypothetical protein [Lachnospiraceae bacterium]